MLDIDALRAYRIPDSEMTLTRRDTILYALSVGLGADPVDPAQLPFVSPQAPKAVPSMATIIAMPYRWISRANAGWGGLSVHAGVDVELYRDVPVEGRFVSQNALHEVLDKGPGQAAIVTIKRRVFDADSGDHLFDIRSTNMFRGDGGFGGPDRSAEPPADIPLRAPDHVCCLPTLPQQGLIYQLNGDCNPLHHDPDAARRQGFQRPILHGLATFGITCHALLKTLCDYAPSRLRSIGGQFRRPVYPGETLSVSMWLEKDVVRFVTRVPERDDAVVIDLGTARIAQAIT